MRNSKFWLYYSLVMMVGFYPVGAFAGVRVENLGWIDITDNDSVKNACMDALSGVCDSDIDKSTICSNRETLPEGCSSNYYGQLFALFEYNGDNSDFFTCNNITNVHLVHTCTGCNSSQMGLQGTAGLCEYGDKLAAGSSGKSIYELMSTGTCEDVDTWSDGVELSVCVTCEILYDNTLWTTFNSTNHTEKRTVTIKNVCNDTESTTTEYRCADGYTHVGGTANTSTMVCGVQTCSNCPTGAYCNSNCDILSCKRGYFFSGEEACTDCDPGTYQPVDNNTESDGESCIFCPNHVDRTTSGSLRQGNTSGYASTKESDCYQPNSISFVDDFGTYNFINDCNYTPVNQSGS